jgi:hypothetical protein
MSKLLAKLKMKKSMKAQMESEQSSSKKDPRFLNYYDLKPNEKMSVLLVPFEEGEMWVRYKKHGPNLKVKGRNVRGVGDINCSHTSSGEQCPACQVGFDLSALAKETGDNSYKVEAKKWFAKNYFLMQCIVLESPCEIQQTPDGNEVKLFLVPYGIEKEIFKNVGEGLIDEDDIPLTPLVIKKTMNGEFAEYDSSYFARNKVDEETLESLEEGVVNLYSIKDLTGDIIPEPTTTEQVQEWLDVAEELYMKATDGDDDAQQSQQSQQSQQEPPKEPSKKTSSLSDRLSRKPVEKKETPEYDDDVPMNMGDDKEPKQPESKQEDEPKSSGGSSVRDRLARLRR